MNIGSLRVEEREVFSDNKEKLENELVINYIYI